MGSLLAMALVFMGGSASARDVALRNEVVASSATQIFLVEFCDPQALPPELKSLLGKTSVPVARPLNLQPQTLGRRQLSQAFRGPILAYNKSLRPGEEPVRLRIPDTVTVLPPRKKITRESVHARLQEIMRDLCPTCEFQISFELPDLPEALKGQPWSLMSFEDRWRGRVNLSLAFESQTFPLPASIRWSQEIIVAKKRILVGHKVQAQNVQRQRRDVTFLSIDSVDDIAGVVGLQATKNIRRGQPLEKTHLRRPNIVSYGMPLRAVVTGDRMSLSVSAKAKGAGALGEVIPIEIIGPRKKVMARILSAKRVEIQ